MQRYPTVRCHITPSEETQMFPVQRREGIAVHNVYFVQYDVTVSFLAQVLDTVTYFVSQVLDTVS